MGLGGIRALFAPWPAADGPSAWSSRGQHELTSTELHAEWLSAAGHGAGSARTPHKTIHCSIDKGKADLLVPAARRSNMIKIEKSVQKRYKPSKSNPTKTKNQIQPITDQIPIK